MAVRALHDAAESHVYAERYLTEDVDDDSVVGKLRELGLPRPRRVPSGTDDAEARRPLEQNLYSYLASRTDLQPYQFKPVLKLLAVAVRTHVHRRRGRSRKDDRGRDRDARARCARRPASRARRLPACAPTEVASRDARAVRPGVRDPRSRRARSRSSATAIFAHAPVKAIASLALLRSADIVEAALRERDAVRPRRHRRVAPHAEPRDGVSPPRRAALGVADHMLMLSATPLSLSTDNLFHQLSILVPEEFFDVVEFSDRIEPNRHLNQAIERCGAPPRRGGCARASCRRSRTCRRATSSSGTRSTRRSCETLETSTATLERRAALPSCSTDQRAQHDRPRLHAHAQARGAGSLPDAPRRRREGAADARPSGTFYDAVTEFVRAQAGADGQLRRRSCRSGRSRARSRPPASTCASGGA